MWTIDSNGQWTTLSNWNSGVADPSGHGGPARLPNANDRVIIDRPAAIYLVTLSSGTQSIRSLFTNERLSITGGILNSQQYVQLNSAATLSSGGIIAASLANAQSFTQLGGVATISGAVTGNGSMNVSGGSFTASSIRQNAITVSGGLVRIRAGANSVSVLKSLSTSGAGKLDLADNDLVIDYSASSPIASIRAQLAAAYNGGAWDGNGLISSTAAAQASLSHRTALGYGEASALFANFPATFHGEAIDSTSIVVAYTANGDANLDGTVDTIDFNSLAANFGAIGKVWTQADFNYDGVVDTLDFNQLAANFGYTLPQPGGGAALVPEPGCIAVLALALSGFATGRRRGASRIHRRHAARR
jgi:hypothetical protein